MHPWRTCKRLLVHCHSRPKVGLRRRKVQLHAHLREGPDDCRRLPVNCASFLPYSKAFVSLLTSWEPYSAIFLQACWSRYSNGSKKGPQSCMDTSFHRRKEKRLDELMQGMDEDMRQHWQGDFSQKMKQLT